MNKRRLWILLVLVFCCSCSVVYGSANEQLQYKAHLGITPQDGTSGVVLAAVALGSPAAEAGLAVGDVLLTINGQALRSVRELQETILPTMAPYTPATIVYQRGGIRAETTIVPTGLLRLTIRDLPPRQFVIPGVPENLPGPRSAVEALDQINVLKQVIIDPDSGSVEVIGSYDKSYATGPLPYLDLLKTALQHPYPNFSLVPTPESLENAKKRELTPAQQTMSVQRLILGHPALEWDRQQLISGYAREYGIAREEYISLLNYFGFDNRIGEVPPSIAIIQERVLRHTGYAEVADAYVLLLSGTPDAAKQALQKLGKAEGDYPGNIRVQAYFAMQEKLQQQPIQWAIDKREEVGRLDQTQLLLRLQAGLLPAWDKNRQNHFIAKVLYKIVLSDEATRIVVKNQQPYEAELMYMAVDPSSQLARILYEADYALKSRNAFPELFAHIPGSMNVFEYMASIGAGELPKFHNGVRTWLEPRQVEMEISPNRKVVTFGASKVRVIEEFHDIEAKQDMTFPDDPAPDANWERWTAQFNDNYDAYARVMPSFHKLREAAKVIALAQWLITEQVPIKLSGVVQEKWIGPRTVPGFRYAGFTLQQSPNGSGSVFRTWAKITGGVKFKSKHNWTTYTPSKVSETHVVGQLALSASLGQKAVQVAQGGNLEQAKYLAELSAQAMNGNLTKSDLAKLPIVVPEPNLTAAAPANVQLQKEMLKKTSQQIQALSQNPAAAQTTGTTLGQLHQLYEQVNLNPLAASDFLIKLQTGQLPPPALQPTVIPKPPIVAVCGETSLGAEALPAERKEFLNKKLADARERLHHINAALRKLIALNAAERAEMERLTEEISQDFDAAKERAYDFAVTTLVDMPLAKYAEVYEQKVKQMEYEIKGLIGKSTTPLSDEARTALQEEIRLKSILKAQYQDAFAVNKKLLETYQGAGYGNDIYKWEQESRQSGGWKKGLDTGLLMGKILLDHPKLEDFLNKKDWFGGNKLWQVVSAGKLAAYGTGFFFDVLDLYFAWGPQMEQMKKDLQYNAQAMEQMRQKAEQTSRQIDCLERLLK